VTPKTVEYHLSHLFEKFGARSRAEVILKAGEKGLLFAEA
jgi:DNA-binding NarL/FixJ family response regulator